MKTKLKVLMVFTILFLVSTIASVIPVAAVKVNGELQVKAHLTAIGPDQWDENTRVEIAANIYYNPGISSGSDKASFKKIFVDPITGEESMLYHGKLKGGSAGWLLWWQNAAGEWWNSVWFIWGIGDVKTRDGTYSDVFIYVIFCFGGGLTGPPWAWAGFWTDPTMVDFLGPFDSSGQEGTLAWFPEIENIGLDKF